LVLVFRRLRKLQSIVSSDCVDACMSDMLRIVDLTMRCVVCKISLWVGCAVVLAMVV
jgi:hypothetical protein